MEHQITPNNLSKLLESIGPKFTAMEMLAVLTNAGFAIRTNVTVDYTFTPMKDTNDPTGTGTITELEAVYDRCGDITLTATLLPVTIAGQRVDSVELTPTEIRANNYRVGSKVAILIDGGKPWLTGLITNEVGSSYWEMPTYCPHCNALIIYNSTSGKLRCPTSWLRCKGQFISGLMHFVSSDAMNIRGIERSQIEKLVEEGHITDPSGFYSLSLAILSRMFIGIERNGRALYSAIQESKSVDEVSFLYALGIPGVTKGMARVLIFIFGTFSDLVIAMRDNKVSFIEEFGVSAFAHQELKSFFNNFDNDLTIRAIMESITFRPMRPGWRLVNRVIMFDNQYSPQKVNVMCALVAAEGGIGTVQSNSFRITDYVREKSYSHSTYEDDAASPVRYLSMEELLAILVS